MRSRLFVGVVLAGSLGVGGAVALASGVPSGPPGNSGNGRGSAGCTGLAHAPSNAGTNLARQILACPTPSS